MADTAGPDSVLAPVENDSKRKEFEATSCCVSRGKAGENASADPAANQNVWRIEELLYAKRNAMHFGISISKLG